MIPLIILGLLQQIPCASGYELLRLMKERHYKYIVNVTKGSFYYHLQQLEDKGYIELAPSSESVHDSKPYSITESGKEEFQRLVEKFGNQSEYVNLAFYGPFLFADEVEPDKLIALMQSQIEQAEEKVKRLTMSIETDQELSVYYRKMLENSREHHRVNINWYQNLIKELKA